MTITFGIPGDRSIQALKPTDPRKQWTDGAGLYLKLLWGEGQAHSWRFDFTSPETGKRRTLTLGAFPAMGVKGAREAAAAARKLIASGVCPAENKQDTKREQAHKESEARASKDRVKRGLPANANAFEALAVALHDARYTEGRTLEDRSKVGGKTWSEAKAKAFMQQMRDYVFPDIGDMDVADIKPRHIRAVVEKVQGMGKRETARQIFARIKSVFNRAVSDELIAGNPCDALHDDLDLDPGHEPYPTQLKGTAIADCFKVLDNRAWWQGNGSMFDAINVLAYTFQRPGNVRLMKWADLHLDGGDIPNSEFTGPSWVIPSQNMKRSIRKKLQGAAHVVPLPPQVVEILKRRRANWLKGERKTDYVFSADQKGKEGVPHAQSAFSYMFARIGLKGKLVPHGFRAMARSILAEKFDVNVDVIERHLAHNTREENGASYDRATFVFQRAEVAVTWADYLDDVRKGGNGGKVVPMPKRKAA